MSTPRPLDVWLDAQRHKAALYRRVAPYLSPPAEFIEVDCRDVRLPAYIRKPTGASRPPVILFISGLDSTREERATFEDVLLRRGLATLTFDGPGQGVVCEHMPGIVALEPRIGAAAACSGLFDLSVRDLTDNLRTPRVLHFWNKPDLDALRQVLAMSTLEGVIQRLDRPLVDDWLATHLR